MKKIQAIQIKDITYLILVLAGVATIPILLQPESNFSLRSVVSYLFFAAIASMTGIMGLKREIVPKRFHWIMQTIAFICYLAIAWWLIIWHYSPLSYAVGP